VSPQNLRRVPRGSRKIPGEVRIRAFQFACLAVLALATLQTAPGLAAQTASTAKGKIAAVRVTGSQRYTEAQIVAASGLRVGEVLGSEEIQAAADRLVQLGPFSSVRFRFSSLGENVIVEFQVAEAPTVPVSFDNFPWFTDAELTDALKQAVGLFDGTAPEQGGILDTMTTALAKLLAGRGVRAAVEHTLMADPTRDGMMLQFKAIGASLRISAVQFSDALAAGSKRVQERLPDLVGKPYSRFAVEVFAKEQVRPLYLERGHLRVRMGTPSARFTGSPDRPLPDSVLVAVPIEPGPVYRFGGVQWQGNGAFGAAALNEFLGLKTGEIADGMKIAAGWHRLEDEYGRRGYLDVKVQTEPVYEDAAKRVTYRVTISEGPTYRMGELVITGVSLAAENKVREAWRLPKGQVFDRVHFDQFLSMLQMNRAAIFGELPIHYDEAGHWLRTNPETRTADVLLDFK